MKIYKLQLHASIQVNNLTISCIPFNSKWFFKVVKIFSHSLLEFSLSLFLFFLSLTYISRHIGSVAFHFGAERALRLGIAWRSSIYQAVSSFAFLYRNAAPYGDLI